MRNSAYSTSDPIYYDDDFNQDLGYLLYLYENSSQTPAPYQGGGGESGGAGATGSWDPDPHASDARDALVGAGFRVMDAERTIMQPPANGPGVADLPDNSQRADPPPDASQPDNSDQPSGGAYDS